MVDRAAGWEELKRQCVHCALFTVPILGDRASRAAVAQGEALHFDVKDLF
jgi:hypothetical protein